MLLENIKTGDRLEITLKREKATGKSYVSHVETVLDNKQVVVHAPISYGQIVKLLPSDVYSFLFFTEKGMLRYDGNIIEYLKEDGFNLLVVSLTSVGERVQRREFFRFTCLLPIRFCRVDEEGVQSDDIIEGIIKDIGGGGIRFVSNAAMEEKDLIKGEIILDGELKVLGRVLHKQHFPKSNYKYQYRVEFLGATAEEQENIVQFIFSEQRKIMQRTRV